MGLAMVISWFITFFIYMIITEIIKIEQLNTLSMLILFIFWFIFFKLIYSYIKEKQLKEIAKNELKIEKYKKEIEEKEMKSKS